MSIGDKVGGKNNFANFEMLRISDSLLGGVSCRAIIGPTDNSVHIQKSSGSSRFKTEAVCSKEYFQKHLDKYTG